VVYILSYHRHACHLHYFFTAIKFVREICGFKIMRALQLFIVTPVELYKYLIIILINGVMKLEDYFLNGEETQLVIKKAAEPLAAERINERQPGAQHLVKERIAATQVAVEQHAVERVAATHKTATDTLSVATENKMSSYHVLVRGTKGHKIFFKREDYCRLLFLLNRFLHSTHSSIYGFVLMTNHAHLLIHSNCINDVVCNLVKGYAGYFYCKYQRPKSIDNHKHNRQAGLEKLPIISSGPKLVNESYSIGVKRIPLIETPVKIVEKISIDYQLDNLYYIINNPILAGLCIRPGGYPYSSYLFYTKHGTFLSQFIDVDTSLIFKNDKTLQAFNKKRSKRLAYQISTKERKKCGIKGDWNEVG